MMHIVAMPANMLPADGDILVLLFQWLSLMCYGYCR